MRRGGTKFVIVVHVYVKQAVQEKFLKYYCIMRNSILQPGDDMNKGKS